MVNVFLFDQSCANLFTNSPCATPPFHSTAPHILHTFHLQPSLCTSYERNFEKNNIRWTQLVGGLEHFLFFPYIGNNHPNWLIFFRGVETTNQTNFAPVDHSFAPNNTRETPMFEPTSQVIFPLDWAAAATWANFAPAMSTIFKRKKTPEHTFCTNYEHHMNTTFAPARSTILKKTPNKSTRKKTHQTSTKFAPAKILGNRLGFEQFFLEHNSGYKFSFQGLGQPPLPPSPQ